MFYIVYTNDVHIVTHLKITRLTILIRSMISLICSITLTSISYTILLNMLNPLGTKGFKQNGDLAVYGASPGDSRRLVSVSVT